MFRIAALFALVPMLLAWGVGGASAQSASPPRSLVTVAYADRDEGPPGLPPVTYDEIVGPPPAAAGYSMAAIAVGAVAGVIAVNTLLPVLGYAAVPATLAAVPVTGTALEAALATSRVVAVAGAVAGGVIGQWVYAGSGR